MFLLWRDLSFPWWSSAEYYWWVASKIFSVEFYFIWFSRLICYRPFLSCFFYPLHAEPQLVWIWHNVGFSGWGLPWLWDNGDVSVGDWKLGYCLSPSSKSCMASALCDMFAHLFHYMLSVNFVLPVSKIKMMKKVRIWITHLLCPQVNMQLLIYQYTSTVFTWNFITSQKLNALLTANTIVLSGSQN